MRSHCPPAPAWRRRRPRNPGSWCCSWWTGCRSGRSPPTATSWRGRLRALPRARRRLRAGVLRLFLHRHRRRPRHRAERCLPHRSGIIGNEWVDVGSGQPLYCTGPPRPATSATRPAPWTAPAAQPEGGDAGRRAAPRRAAFQGDRHLGQGPGRDPAGGKTGTAYMYMGGTGQFASTTYYMQQHPGWVTAFNAAKPADRFFKPVEAAAAGSGIRALAAGQPALVRPGRRQAADDDGQ